MQEWQSKKSKHSEWTQWDEAKSGRQPVSCSNDRATSFLATQYHYYRAVLAIFPLTPDQIRAQIWPNGLWGVSLRKNIRKLSASASVCELASTQKANSLNVHCKTVWWTWWVISRFLTTNNWCFFLHFKRVSVQNKPKIWLYSLRSWKKSSFIFKTATSEQRKLRW